jgi:hypothetical protein
MARWVVTGSRGENWAKLLAKSKSTFFSRLDLSPSACGRSATKGHLAGPHLASGGKIVGLAERSMVVHEPLPFWENWSKQRFETSGNYALEGTIAPVKIDVDRQIGTYEEPNVWVAYAA